MSDIKIRLATEDDIDQLKKLWKMVFDDSDKFLKNYFENYFHPEKTYVADLDGKIVSMTTVYENGGLLTKTGESSPCPCIYAVATHPAHRGHAYAMALIDRALQDLKAQGMTQCMIAPASASLSALYKEKFGFQEAFYGSLLKADSGDISPWEYEMDVDKKPELKVVNGAKYGILREKMLKGRNHLSMSSDQLKLIKDTCSMSGGNLYELKNLQGKCLAAIERISNKEVRVTELLLENPDDLKTAMAAIRMVFHADRYRACLPQEYGAEDVPYGFKAGDLTLESPSFSLERGPRALLINATTNDIYAGFLFD